VESVPFCQFIILNLLLVIQLFPLEDQTWWLEKTEKSQQNICSSIAMISDNFLEFKITKTKNTVK